MKRFIVTAAGAGLLALALVGTATTAGASAAQRSTAQRSTAQRSRPGLSIPWGATGSATISVGPNTQLKGGEKVKVVGSGFPAKASLVLLECNDDGDGPGPTSGSCDLQAGQYKTPKTSSTGTFTAIFTIVEATNVDGKDLPDTSCPQGKVETEHSVMCILAADDIATKTFAFEPIFFTAPALKLSYAKGSIVKGKQTYNVTITETGDYAPNVGGYEVFGEGGSPLTKLCQGSVNDKTVWTGADAPGWPVCTVHIGEVAEIFFGGRKVDLLRVGVSSPGTFTYTQKNVNAGKYAVEALGLTSGLKLTATADVP